MKNWKRVTSLLPISLLPISLLSIVLLGGLTPAIAQTATQGYTLLNRGWVNDAISAFQQALRANPQSLEARLGLAIAYQRAGRDSDAWSTYQQVLRQDPTNRSALQAVGLLGSYRSEWQPTGIAALTTLLQQTPNDSSVRAQRALLYGYQGRFTEAIADYDRVLAANPTPDTVLQAAQIYTYSGDYSRALTLFERYRATGRPQSDSGTIAYALALRETGKPDQAVQLLERRLNPKQPQVEIQTALAVAYYAVNRPTDADALLATLRRNPNATLPLARSLSTIGRQFRQADRYREAIDLYRRVLQQTPNPSPGLVVEVADVMSEVAETRSEALSLYQRAIQQQPNDEGLKFKQLVVQRQLGQISRTDFVQQLQARLQPLPTDRSQRQRLAQALVSLDPPEPSLLPVYRDLLQSGVDAPFLNFRVAQIQVQQGEYAAARSTLAAYQKTTIGARDSATDLLLADLDRREGKLDASAQRYEAIIAGNFPDAAQRGALRGLAGVRQLQGRSGDALQLYDQLLSRNPEDGAARLGRTYLAYRVKQVSQTDAEAVLNQWLQTQSVSDAPPELFSLVGALPADPQREELYARLLAIDPDNLAIERRRLNVLALRDPDRARSQAEELVRRNPSNPDVYFVQGELAQQLRDFTLASQAYEAIVQRQPNNPDALAALGGIRFEQKRYQEAIALYERVVSLRPNDWDARRILAELSLAQDQPFTALQQFRQLRQQQATTNESDPTIANRIERLEVDRLKRRGFQPSWERY
ncbi:tetratricopeptide repeat protein [Leptolyngbya sp. FACHB-36]|uniref:tetratricopeptide repeat protein n=1 Tax=Leptolyngbya sp. FACHB-36 TaxID=2692808 RepID=UPI001681B4C1|nr:tetratricopeptide repeat protein [Leptolyngbya sp. FACHB-36]MBD2022061.1 tetratricopeptide repeat protein [Leptolyngbya sp. FACHB-36]